MKQVHIKTKNLLKILPRTLKKDLQDHERICPTCKGFGVTTENNIYGIQGDTNPTVKGIMFPYKRQALTFCPDCYNGVQKLCPHCGKAITRYITEKCDCEGYKAHQEAAKLLKWNDIIAKAKEVQESEVTTMLYCEENGEYYADTDDFKESWEDSEEYPERLWVTTAKKLHLDAYDILENECSDLHEDALDNCNISDLQAILDKYVAQQSGTTTYYPCYDEYILIKK